MELSWIAAPLLLIMPRSIRDRVLVLKSPLGRRARSPGWAECGKTPSPLVGTACMGSIAEQRFGLRRGDETRAGRLNSDIMDLSRRPCCSSRKVTVAVLRRSQLRREKPAPAESCAAVPTSVGADPGLSEKLSSWP